jgi:hypothetical protein
MLPAVHVLQFEEEEDEDEYFENTDDALYDLPIGGEDCNWHVDRTLLFVAGCASDAASILQIDSTSTLQQV